jgi:hypothetical protein
MGGYYLLPPTPIHTYPQKLGSNPHSYAPFSSGTDFLRLLVAIMMVHEPEAPQSVLFIAAKSTGPLSVVCLRGCFESPLMVEKMIHHC